MNEMDGSKRPWVFIELTALTIGLISFFLWLIRQISKPVEAKPATSSSAGELPVDHDFNPIQPHISSVEDEKADTKMTEDKLIPFEAVINDKSIPKPTSDNDHPWTAPTRYLAGIGIFIFFIWLIIFSRQTLALLVFAALIAILVRPAILFLQKRAHFSKGLAIVFSYLVVAVLVFILPVLIIPNIIHAVATMLSYDWQNVLNSISGVINNFADHVAAIPLIGHSLANPLSALSNAAQNIFNAQKTTPVQGVPITEQLTRLGEKIGFLGGLISPLASGILSLVFMLLISLHMSLASDQIKGWIETIFPDHYKGEIGNLVDRIVGVWTSFLRGQFSLMVLMGILTWVLNLLLGTPQAFLLGILAGLLEVIPNLGPLLATIPAAILAALFGSSMFPGLNPWLFMLIVILGYVLLQFMENQFMVPRILGNAVSLPPLVVIIGVTIAGTQAGVAGVFLATPIIASGKEILDYVSRKINQVPETIEPIENKPSFREQLRGMAGKIQMLFRRTGRHKVEPSEITDTGS